MNRIGVMVVVRENTDFLKEFEKLQGYGFTCCQLSMWNPERFTDAVAAEIQHACEVTGVEVSTLWCGWTGPTEWNFTGGPMTLGLVPPTYRMKRAEQLIKGGEFAEKLGVRRVATHVGFLPENRNDPEYFGILAVLRWIIGSYAKRGISFLFETGQETPTTLLRVIEELGMDNVGINMDTANLILYGKANSADAITVFGKYVMDTHIKDGFYPTDGNHLGAEVKVGEGMANLPEVVRRLHAVGYKGNYIIEREIEGDQQIKDILDTKRYLEHILKEA